MNSIKCIKCRACHKEIDDTPFCPWCGASQAPVAKSSRARGNGQGTVYKLPNGKWRAEVTLGWNGRKRVVKTKSGFLRKKDALDYIPTLKSEPVDVDTKITFKGIYDLWSVAHYEKISKSTADGYRKAFEYCSPIHYYVFSKIKTADLQKVVDESVYIKDGKKIETGRRTKADIQSLYCNLYKYALENDYCTKDYSKFVNLPPKEKSKKDAFTDLEIAKLWKDYNSGNDFTGYILIMIYTGMRYGEISKIKKENIYLEERYMIGGIKTQAGIDRVIPIAQCILPIVQKFFDAGKKKILEMDDKVFYNQFYAVLEKCSIRKLNPHCCRHTFATLMASSGIQPAIITETMGHEDYQTTLNYTHIPLSDKLNAVDSLEVVTSSSKK